MGPSGTGKTTLIKLNQRSAQARRWHRGGRTASPVHRLSQAALFRLRRRMGMMFQSGALLTDLSVFDNVAYPLAGAHGSAALDDAQGWCC